MRGTLAVLRLGVSLLASIVGASACGGKAAPPLLPAAPGDAVLPMRAGACVAIHQRFREFAGWRIDGISTLPDTAANARDSVWAVGSAQYPPLTPIALHYSHGAWHEFNLPRPYKETNVGRGIAALADDDVWVVGSGNEYNAPAQPFVEHYDGKVWRVVSSPAVKGGSLDYVTAVAANDVWATGAVISGRLSHPLRERWDGKKWSAVVGGLAPNPLGSVSFTGAPIAVSASRLAAPVTQQLGNRALRAYVAFGGAGKAAWKLVALGAKAPFNEVTALARDRSGQMFAAGFSETANSYSAAPTAWIETYDGRSFVRKRIAAAAGARPEAAAFSDGGAFIAVGSTGPYSHYSAWVAGEFDGAWTGVALPKHPDGAFASVAPIPGTSGFWAAGNPETPLGKPYVWKFTCT